MRSSLFVFLIATIGGRTTASGALFGGVFFALIPEVQRRLGIENLQYVFIGIAAIFLAQDPNGFGGNISLLGEQLRARRRRARATEAVAVPEAASWPIPALPPSSSSVSAPRSGASRRLRA